MDQPPAPSMEARYSRQIYAVGAGAMRRVLQARVVVVGLGSTGSELAKNVLLSGCPCVGLYDDTPVVHPRHTESNFFLPRGTSAVGAPRAAAVLPALTPLNATASVALLPVVQNSEHVSYGARVAAAVVAFRATVVALCDPLALDGWTPEDIVDFTTTLRAHSIPVVVTETYGVFCRVFNDFGDAFVVEDAVGEDPALFPVVALEKDASALKVVVDVNDHMLPVVGGDRVRLSCGDAEVVALVASRTGSDTVIVEADVTAEVDSRTAFNTWAAASMAPCAPRIALREYRVPTTVAHQPWASVLGPDRTVAPADEPHVLSMTRDNAASAGAFAARHRHGHGDVVADIVDALGETTGTKFIATMGADIAAVAALVGGVASQEVLKAATGRLMPITQCWYYDFREIIVDAAEVPSSTPAQAKLADAMPSHAAVFGGGIAIDRFRNADIFVVGAGAIGCEYLKNLAVIGAGTGPKGRITVTDMDSIEVSNLSRQFLFREQHVGHNKAVTAAEAIKKVFGPKLKVRALQEKVSAETAHRATGVFNKRFWGQCSVICTAVDNVAAREFLDDCAASYRKPMIDSGTQAARGHVEVFAPHLTARFRDASAPADAGKAVPFCTLHFFPTTVEHCVQFATDLFAGQFSAPPANANRCVFDHPDVDAYVRSLDRGVRLQNLRSVYATLCEAKPTTWRDACAWARGLFETVFVFPPRQLLLSYPLDKTDTEGRPYWSGTKRPPTVPTFDLTGNPLHRAFVVSAAAILCRVHGVASKGSDDTQLAAAIDGAELPVFVPKAVNAEVTASDDPGDATKGTTVEEDIAQAEARAAEDSAEQQELVRRISDAAIVRRATAAKLNPEVFEKDDEGNSHVDFIASVANIRATAYGIPNASSMDVKRIAGRIVPAMITTTAVVTGLATLQACRILAVGKTADPDAGVWATALKGSANTSVNLADMNFTQSFEPSPPVRKPFFVRQSASGSAVAVAGSPTFTSWDELTIDDKGNDPTIGEAIERVAAKYHGIVVLQIVEASHNAWVYDATAGEEPQKELGFPLIGWTQRLLGLSDDAVAALGTLTFVLRCAPPASVVDVDPEAAVSVSLPPLVVHV